MTSSTVRELIVNNSWLLRSRGQTMSKTKPRTPARDKVAQSGMPIIQPFEYEKGARSSYPRTVSSFG